MANVNSKIEGVKSGASDQPIRVGKVARPAPATSAADFTQSQRLTYQRLTGKRLPA